MRRLYLQIYLAVLAALILFAVLMAIGFKLSKWDSRNDRGIDSVIVELASEVIRADANQAQVQAAITRLHTSISANISVFNADGTVFAQVGEMPMRFPDADELADAREGDIWSHSRHGPSLFIPLPAGRVIAAKRMDSRRAFGPGARGLLSLATLLTLVGVAVAIVSFPVARRLTRRVESLQSSVQAFGAGDLSARTPVRGKDEVARLARSFNNSADHIEALVQSQKSLLANASHELRSPLARIRMASELIENGEQPKPEMMDELRRNVGELDELVDEILLASRLDAQSGGQVDKAQWAELDLGGLLAEEAARAGLPADIESAPMVGDARLLRRLLRNLIENALRYGGNDELALKDRDIAISLKKNATGIRAMVCDRGPGIAPEEQIKIFEPFYRASGASERAGGVGLGLSLVRQIAQVHKGEARCEPREGGGSCFIVDFMI